MTDANTVNLPVVPPQHEVTQVRTLEDRAKPQCSADADAFVGGMREPGLTGLVVPQETSYL